MMPKSVRELLSTVLSWTGLRGRENQNILAINLSSSWGLYRRQPRNLKVFPGITCPSGQFFKIFIEQLLCAKFLHELPGLRLLTVKQGDSL